MKKSVFKHGARLRAGFQAVLLVLLLLGMKDVVKAQEQELVIRISEIEVYSQYLEEYKAILKYEAEASVRLEPGVIAIFPMFQKDYPTQIRILEMYENQAAYLSHLKTEHFLEYKKNTLPMVKSLKLVDMDALDLEAARQIFVKLKD